MPLVLKPVNINLVRMRLKGTSDYISHCWSDKAKKAMRDKHAGRKAKTREARDCEGEAKAATYWTENQEPGVPAMAVKRSILTAAHKDLGLARTMVSKAVFLRGPEILPISYEKLIVREDTVRVGVGSTDLRYRPQFSGWGLDLTLEVDYELLQLGDLINLVNRAGFGVGVGEWRPERSGEFGRFEIDRDVEVVEEKII